MKKIHYFLVGLSLIIVPGIVISCNRENAKNIIAKSGFKQNMKPKEQEKKKQQELPKIKKLEVESKKEQDAQKELKKAGEAKEEVRLEAEKQFWNGWWYKKNAVKISNTPESLTDKMSRNPWKTIGVGIGIGFAMQFVLGAAIVIGTYITGQHRGGNDTK
ncbi:hypothetical protein [Mycoplasma phocimorsus]|uniref:hypothetical protein n=1 Tax=Mycoplasma phocimorsus TaxID=3045839 RepID=UPI0024C0D38A|nr:hypothetical protein [Mycoplasma phocimorsus]MDJ1648715.1 hypothetical protein [Mycoplasma phocimorsus]